MIKGGALLLCCVALAVCDNRPSQWDAYVYPDQENLNNFERIAGFKTFEQCQVAAGNRVNSFLNPLKASYECGYKCAYNADMQIDVCKKTRK